MSDDASVSRRRISPTAVTVQVRLAKESGALGAAQRVLHTGIVDATDVAAVAGTTPRSVLRWQAATAEPRRDAEARMLELAAVLDLAGRIMPRDSARLWMRSPVPDLDWQRPLELIAAGRFREVIDSLDALAEGVVA